MRDLFNREVQIGDMVEFNPPRYKELKFGIVLTVSVAYCQIEWTDSYNRTMKSSRNQVMILPKESYPEYYL